MAEREKFETVTERVAAGLANPSLSVTVNAVVKAPGVEYVMLPGAAVELVLGLPPANVQE